MKDINKLLEQMTIEEKIGQLVQFPSSMFSLTDEDLTGPFKRAGITDEEVSTLGHVIGGKNAEALRAIQDKHLEMDRNKIPLLFMRDIIHGYRTIYPIPLALGCSFDTDLVAECSEMASKEAAAGGTHVTFTPMVDYVRDPRWGRVMESCGEDPLLNSKMGIAQVQAFQGDDLSDRDRIVACVKHFAAYGGAEAGRDYNMVDVSEHTLRELYFPAYKACLDAGAKMLMPSFNTLNGVPATANSWLMKTILKEEWHADPLVISDWGAVGMLKEHGTAATKKEASKLAFDCGCHIDMCGGTYIKYMKSLVEEGEITMEQLDDAVLKVLSLKNELGLFEDPYHGASKEREDEVLLIPEHRAIARRAAAECAVLLKNEELLPFAKDVKKVALIGPFAETNELKGAWPGKGVDDDTISVKEGIRAMLPNAELLVARGCTETLGDQDKSGFDEAITVAKEADIVILCLGEAQKYSGEATSRTELTLPGVQDDLAEEVIKANPNTAVVLFTGRPLVLKRLDAVAPAILNMWFPGTEAGNAVVDLLFGDANPCGKLSMSFPKAVGQCPIYYNRLNTGRPKSMEEDEVYKPFHSNYMDCGNLPLYSFGHGLSYSNFVYEGLELSVDEFCSDEKVTVTITVHNDSDYAGKETVMLYMRDKVATNARPVQQLIAFEKVMFKAHETKKIQFVIEEEMLRFWNNEHKFVSEPGVFEISTGYADHLLHTKKLILK